MPVVSFQQPQEQEEDEEASTRTLGAGVCNMPSDPGSSRMRQMSSDGCSSVREMMSEYSRRVDKVLTFKDNDKSLLRGIPLSAVLHRWAKILSSSEGTAEDYEWSSVVSQLDAFLSHTWTTPRVSKYLTLVIYCNVIRALLVGLGCSAVTFLLIVSGLIPEFHFLNNNRRQIYGILCQLVGHVTYLLAILLFHEVGHLCGAKGPAVFLDKACVHQTDVELKRKGIQSLAAYLHNSKSLIVLYSDAYLSRLWTVYELASFLLAQPQGKVGKLELLPVGLPLLLFGVLAVNMLHTLFCGLFMPCNNLPGMTHRWAPHVAPAPHHGMEFPAHAHSFYGFHGTNESDIWVCLATLTVPLTVLIHFWARKLAGIQHRLEHFDIRSAECKCEEDRPVVEGNVEAFVKHLGKVAPDAPQAEALAAFNGLVQRTVPGLVKSSLGHSGIRYRHAVVLFTQSLFAPFDYLAAIIHQGGNARLAVQMMRSLLCVLSTGPLMVAAAAYLSQACAHWRGVRSIAALVMNCVIVQCATRALTLPMQQLAFHFDTTGSWEVGVGFLAYCSFQCLITFMVYQLPRARQQPADCPKPAEKRVDGGGLPV